MKKLLFLFLFITILSCGVTYNIQNTIKSNNWYPVEMKPSQVKTNGAVFYSINLNDTEDVAVYLDNALLEDGTYYYNQLWESYGWTRQGGDITTASAYASKPSLSTLHISIKRGVAIYIYPDAQFQIFKVIKN